MAEEEVVAAASPETSEHKRKLEEMELEPEAPMVDPNASSNIASITALVKEHEEEEEAVNGGGVESDESEAKRPRLEENKPDGTLATENGYQEENVDEPKEEFDKEQPVENNNIKAEDTQEPGEKDSETVKNEEAAIDDHLQPSDENPQLENAKEEPSKEEFEERQQEIKVLHEQAVSQQGDVSYVEQQSGSESQTMSRKMEVPNAKVGVLIGKAGDTIRYLQLNSGARIQITRDADADPHAPTRPVELIGSLENINKAERLIKDVIAEADAGGSPALVARGFNTVQSSAAGEQIEIKVPYEKVGIIIGKGGETIKNLQTRSGARLQLIPQRLPEGDQSRERTVRITGDKKQIEMAEEMIKEVMNQQVRPSPLSSGYNQQGSRPRGPAGSQWGPQGPRPHQTGYDYPQRGPPYPSHHPQMPPSYGSYPPQQMDPRTNFNRDQRPPSTMQGPPPQGGGYNYYGGQAGPTASGPNSNPVYGHGHGATPAGPPHSNYNYGQPQGLEYGQPAPYSQTAPPAQNYGHAPQQNPYGHSAPQQPAYPQGGYGPQDQYGKPPHAQSYVPPRANQPGDVPYQGPPSTQSYGPNVPTQQPYPYTSSGPVQQTYPPYGSAPTADGYNHPPPTTTPAPAPGYQGGQPFGQPAGQQAPVYTQAAPTGGYGSYPSSQPGYQEQAAPNSAGYGYQGPTDPAYGAVPAYGAPPTGQPAYSQPAPVQPGYDQSVPQSGSYGAVPGAVPVGSGYPQYDASQMYGAPR